MKKFFYVISLMGIFILQHILHTSYASSHQEFKDFKPRPYGNEAKLAGLNSEILAKIDIEMQRHIAKKNVAGVVCLIYHNGHIGYFEAFGWQDIEEQKPMKKDTIFQLMSMTKPITVVTALVLYDEGKFSLDEPISKYLPEWQNPKVLENDKIVPAKYPITPRMLMTHSSGLYYGELDSVHLKNNGSKLSDSNKKEELISLEDFSEVLSKTLLKFHPGTGFQYGHSIDILGRFIEAITQKPLNEVIHEKLTGPLKMVDTDFWVPPEKIHRLCTIYKQPHPGVLLPVIGLHLPMDKPKICMGGHGMFGTALDYAKFCKMLINRGEIDGVRVLKPETVDLIFQNHLNSQLNQKYGLGGIVDGEGIYGWGGSLGTRFLIDRKHNFFVIFMVQTEGYKAPTYSVFLSLAKESAGIPDKNPENFLKKTDKNNEDKLTSFELSNPLF